MALSYSSGTTSVTGSVAVTINGNLPLPATGQTNLDIFAQKTGSGTIHSRANTATKTVWLYGFDWSVRTAAGGATNATNLSLLDNATTLWAYTNTEKGSVRFSKPIQITNTLVASWTAAGGTDVIYITLTAIEQ